MSVGEVTGLIVAITGLLGIVLAHRLGLRGQRKESQAQIALGRLQERKDAFDELESLNDRLMAENKHLRETKAEDDQRLRELLAEMEATGNLRLARQARRCREQLDEAIAAIAALQAVVLAEITKASADVALDRARDHLSTDHPDTADDGSE